MVDLQTKNALKDLERDIKLLYDENATILDAEVALDGFKDGYDCIDVRLKVRSAKDLKTPDYIQLFQKIRELVRDEGFTEWVDCQVVKTIIVEEK